MALRVTVKGQLLGSDVCAKLEPNRTDESSPTTAGLGTILVIVAAGFVIVIYP